MKINFLSYTIIKKEFENLLDKHTKINVPKGYQVVNAKKRTEKKEKTKKSDL